MLPSYFRDAGPMSHITPSVGSKCSLNSAPYSSSTSSRPRSQKNRRVEVHRGARIVPQVVLTPSRSKIVKFESRNANPVTSPHCGPKREAFP